MQEWAKSVFFREGFRGPLANRVQRIRTQDWDGCHLDVRVQAMRKGDSAAWAAVYEQLADRVFQHALYRLAGDREAAEVITQEVFLRAIESIDSYEPQRGTLLGWLRGICRRAIARPRRPVARRRFRRRSPPPA